MDTAEDHSLPKSEENDVKDNLVTDIDLGISHQSNESNVCHQTNGVAEVIVEETSNVVQESAVTGLGNEQLAKENVAPEKIAVDNLVETDTTTDIKDEVEDQATAPVAVKTNEVQDINDPDLTKIDVSTDVVVESNNLDVAGENLQETTVVVTEVFEPLMESVTFETEIVVESNDTDVKPDDNNTELPDPTSNILSQLGQSIELSEALRSSDVIDSVENNNCSVGQEVFNKEELLDILEGNDVEETTSVVDKIRNVQSESICKSLETQIALQQLSQLRRKKRRSNLETKIPKKKRSENKDIKETEFSSKKEVKEIESSIKKEIKKSKNTIAKDDKKIDTSNLQEIKSTNNSDVKEVKTTDDSNASVIKKEESIVNVLVMDWDDEDTVQEKEPEKLLEEGNDLLNSSNVLVNTQESVTTGAIDTTPVDTPQSNKSGDETQPQRRLGRVIKKKVIFDPDNPDTFTKSKVSVKRETQPEKEPTVHKKIKTEQATLRSESKSPIGKLQWKKPSSKSSKQCRRTEIDRLLMDEGAVNMIYQLTPEAPKGKKNMKTKAEFIKKIQSSTPDGKEMKFRERKKEKSEEVEAKKILGVKQRHSLSNSVKSPSVSEDFEAHSADDSIIYRRHSSSSYSSSCMSPRRLSDVESSANLSNAQLQSKSTDSQNVSNINSTSNEVPPADDFLTNDINSPTKEVINKDDCLSIKKKLNSKLSLALKKRKREINKSDKPPKQKRLNKSQERTASNSAENYKYLSITIESRLAQVCIKSGSKFNREVVNELANALASINLRMDVSVTMLIFESGVFCGGLDLSSLINDNIELRTQNAYGFADTIRSLLCEMEHHSKLLCCGVDGQCSGIGLALVTLCDVSVASELSIFSLKDDAKGDQCAASTLIPGTSVLTTSCRPFAKAMLNDLVIFDRKLSASEAFQGGLISRVIWPNRFKEQMQDMAKDFAAQSIQNIKLKKQLLTLGKAETRADFLKCLERERDLFVEYWSSEEGQKSIQANMKSV